METGPSRTGLPEPGLRRSPQDLARLLADEFIEFGSSGRIGDKQQVVEALQHESVRQISLTEFAAALLAPGIMLITYRIVERSARKEYAAYSLHSPIWKFTGGRWQTVFQQVRYRGSPCGAEVPSLFRHRGLRQKGEAGLRD